MPRPAATTLRLTQGDPAAILDCGYIVVEYDEPFWWIYEVNSDEQTFSVLLDDDHAATWPWSALPTDSQFLAQANALGGEWGVGYLIRPASQDARLIIPADTLAEVLTPRGCDARPGPGYGDPHLQGDGFEISFSGEDDGWHVIIEGDLANLDTDEKDVADQGRDIRDSVQIEHFGELSDVLRVAGPRGECLHRQEVFWRELVDQNSLHHHTRGSYAVRPHPATPGRVTGSARAR